MTAKKILSPYNGMLEIDAIVEGMNASIHNAKRLFADARILRAQGSPASALSLAILSIEESGKISILRRLALCNNDKEAKDVWKEFRNHRSKNSQWIIFELAKEGAKTLDELRECVNAEGEHTSILDALKQLGFYTDCIGNRKWSTPNKAVDVYFCDSILKVAEIFSEKKEITQREIELWVQHLGNGNITKETLVNWYKAMSEERLTDIELEEVYSFVDAQGKNAQG